MTHPFDFKGRTVLVTGGTRGIGSSLVRAFHEGGAQVIVTGTGEDSIAKARSRDLEAGIEGVRYEVANFADPASLEQFLDKVSAWGSLDICVNNAGINRNNPLAEIDPADLERILRVNLHAPMRVCKAAAMPMRKGGKGGRIVNVGSIWSVIAKEGRSVYGATKAGIASFSRHIAVDLASEGILVNTVSPGFTMTELTESMLSQQEIKELAAQVPMGRIADPIEMTKVILFLCSEHNTFLTGQNVVVDGGFSIV